MELYREKPRGCQVFYLFVCFVPIKLHVHYTLITATSLTALPTKERNSHEMKSAAHWYLPTVLASVGFHKRGMRDECKLNINHKVGFYKRGMPCETSVN